MKFIPSLSRNRGTRSIKAILRGAGIYQVEEDEVGVGARAREYRDSKREVTLEEKYVPLDTAFTIVLALLIASLVLHIILLWR